MTETQQTSAKVVLISGGGRGIGAAVAQRFLQDGWSVSIGMRKPQPVPWMQPWLERTSHNTLQLVAYDAFDATAEARWVAAAMQQFGRIDAVVANAGIAIAKSVVDIAEDEFQQLLDVNVKAPRRLGAAAWEPLKACGCGRIIVLASLSGKRVKTARTGSYSTSKFAAVALAHGFRHAGFDAGIRATAICPSFVVSDMALSVGNNFPAEKMTQPEDLARIIAMLVNLPNEASVAEFAVHCQLEESY